MRGILTIDPRIDDEVIMIPLHSIELEEGDWKDLPRGTEDRETHSESNTDVVPCVGTNAVEHVFPSGVLSTDADWREVSSDVAHCFVFFKY